MSVIPLHQNRPGAAHAVHFFQDHEKLCEVVADYLGAGLRIGETVIAIATERHRRGITQRMLAAGLDLEAARQSGQLIELDAVDLLSKLMVGGLPDPQRFRDHVSKLVVSLGDGRPVRAYGEMVDLLWRTDNPRAALALEGLWNQLARERPLTLLCAYLVAGLYAQPTELAAVCAAHSEVHGHAAGPGPHSDGTAPAHVEALLGTLSSQPRVGDPLRRSERQLELVTESLPALVSYVDAEQRYCFVNGMYEEWFHTPRADIVGRTLRDVLGDKAYAEIAPHAARALAGERVRFESRIEYAGAGTRHIEASYIPYREPGGPVLGFVALVTDVGERKRAEAERIRTAERTERLMRITAAIADAVTQEQVYDAVVDQVAHALQASSAGLWVLGADRTARLVRSLHYAPERIARFEQAPLDLEPSFPVLDVMRSGQPIFLSSQAELLARYPHLEPVLAATPQCDYRLGCMPVMVGGRPLAALAFTFDEGPVIDTAGGHFLMVVARYAGQALERLGLLAAEQDSRALAEAGRLRAELLYGLARAVIAASNVEQVFDATLDVIGRALGAERSAILVYDDAGVMRFRAWRGLSPDYRAAVEGHSPWPRDVSAPEPVLVADALGDASLAAYRPLLQRERIGALGFIPLVAGGKLLGKFMVYYDKPRALDPAELALARAIADHVAAALARFTAMQELEQTVRFNELFTGVLGHDLRNPLGAIMTAAQLMLRRGDSERAVKPLSRIMTSGDRMARMIDQLLDLTRVRVGDGIPLDPREGDLGALVHQVVDELDDAHPEWKLRVEVTGATAGSWDVDRLSQVFSNLVANALQHGEVAHGVTVRVDGRAEAQLTVEVLNMGVIPEALLPKLFDPMTGSERRRDRSRGLGLGLFITREILRAHGGSIAVTSSPMAGTCFRVVIPRRQGAR